MQSDSFHDWYNMLVETLGQEQVVALFQAAAIRGLIGAVLGLALSFAAYRGFRHLRWYGGTSTAGQWVQRSVFIVVTLITMLLVGAAGLLQGVRQQSQAAITHSKLGTDALPVAADLCADCMAWIDVIIQHGGFLSKAVNDPRIEAFRAGAWELDVPAFLRRIDSMHAQALQDALAQLEQILLEKSPNLKGGLTEKLLHQVIKTLGTVLLEKRLSDEMHRLGIDHLYQAIHTQLIAEAALHGNPTTINRHDLSAFLLREGIVPAITTPIRSFARHQQIIYLVIAAFACLFPPLLFRVLRKSLGPATDNHPSVAP